MTAVRLNFTRAKKYLPHIILIGVGIGTANYFMNPNLNWIQWVIQSISNSFIIGYTLVLIASNKSWFKTRINPIWKLYFVLFVAFFLVGSLASEVERIIGPVFFNDEGYQPFSAGKMYAFNGVISMVLGFSFFLNDRLFPSEDPMADRGLESPQNQKNIDEKTLENVETISQVPVKKGDTIFLVPVEEIAYLEAYDNYSFLFDVKGEKKLCDYSLLFLEKRLGNAFLRVHRKYMVNVGQIKQFKPHMNGRYVIHFNSSEINPIMSSKGYSNVIRKLIKLR
ncbi:LytTR family DNA-binding domain-containing protein [Flagellimonas allohymeniacidonis]|uniref:LytTR family transcriptional regulator n=1 Tax=Flagellimonas allohymeniacidonis TaxID=2517819 RepID=A0A4Q8QAE0_9FLAO|nr:LytTR family DNA-binding domain-containing protein [Allomuricauda hymeniacidonis]TAI47265.1 LytTR family transcriptional regulator [Allomuricauda hymeniacidonis]